MLECDNIIINFNENLNKSGNLRKDIKSELEHSVKALKNVIINQNNVINILKLKINSELEMRLERHNNEMQNINIQLNEINNKLQAILI